MKHRRSFSLVGALFAVTALGYPGAGSGAPPDARDQRVLQAALLHLVADPGFVMPGAARDGRSIVLSSRSATGTGMIESYQMRSDVGSALTIPDDLEKDLLRRNATSQGSSVVVSFGGSNLDSRITVADLTTGEPPAIERRPPFSERFPQARGWVEPWLPGYSKDGRRAIIRAWVGPSPHGASVTVLLERSGRSWVVRWSRIAHYA